MTSHGTSIEYLTFWSLYKCDKSFVQIAGNKLDLFMVDTLERILIRNWISMAVERKVAMEELQERFNQCHELPVLIL